MPGLATALTALLRLRARACVLLACLASVLCMASSASAQPSVQTKTRVWDFESAPPLNTWLYASASLRLHLENQLARSEPALGSPHAARGAGAASRVLGQTPRNLQKFFGKHGSDFGLTGNWNPSRAADASRVINQHINSPGVRAIEGAYRGNPATHFLDPKTGLNVVADPAGNFVTGYRLGAEQLESVLTTGHLF